MSRTDANSRRLDQMAYKKARAERKKNMRKHKNPSQYDRTQGAL